MVLIYGERRECGGYRLNAFRKEIFVCPDIATNCLDPITFYPLVLPNQFSVIDKRLIETLFAFDSNSVELTDLTSSLSGSEYSKVVLVKCSLTKDLYQISVYFIY